MGSMDVSGRSVRVGGEGGAAGTDVVIVAGDAACRWG